MFETTVNAWIPSFGESVARWIGYRVQDFQSIPIVRSLVVYGVRRMIT